MLVWPPFRSHTGHCSVLCWLRRSQGSVQAQEWGERDLDEGRRGARRTRGTSLGNTRHTSSYGRVTHPSTKDPVVTPGSSPACVCLRPEGEVSLLGVTVRR